MGLGGCHITVAGEVGASVGVDGSGSEGAGEAGVVFGVGVGGGGGSGGLEGVEGSVYGRGGDGSMLGLSVQWVGVTGVGSEGVVGLRACGRMLGISGQ